jgi:hypothetical protein
MASSFDYCVNSSSIKEQFMFCGVFKPSYNHYLWIIRETAIITNSAHSTVKWIIFFFFWAISF